MTEYYSRTRYQVEFIWENDAWTNWHASPRRYFDDLDSARKEEEDLAAKHTELRFRVVRIRETREACESTL